MTLEEILEDLRGMDGDAPLVFTTADGPIGPGYHITELRQADVTGIDCGGGLDTWREAVMQLLDGQGRAYLPVGKFQSILAKSLSQVDGLGKAPLRVEFAHGNAGLGMFAVACVKEERDTVRVVLTPEGAVCKPALRKSAPMAALCCGSLPSASACCA